jgi:hypothetical protein
MNLFRILTHIVHDDSWLVYHIMQILVRLLRSYHGHATGRPEMFHVLLVYRLSFSDLIWNMPKFENDVLLISFSLIQQSCIYCIN